MSDNDEAERRAEEEAKRRRREEASRREQNERANKPPPGSAKAVLGRKDRPDYPDDDADE